jgi:hypothetical protein
MVKMHNIQVGDYLHVLGASLIEVYRIERSGANTFVVYNSAGSIPYDHYFDDGRSCSGPQYNLVAHFKKDFVLMASPGKETSLDELVDTDEGDATSSSDEVDPVCSDEVGPVGDEALRFNQGKTPYGNLPLDLLDGAARVMAYGEKRYGRANYRKGYTDLMSPYHSLLRHALALQPVIEQEQFQEGGPLYDESGEAHVHHIITSALILNV